MKALGGVAQLGEHLLCKQGVRSSILLISTIGTGKDELNTIKYVFQNNFDTGA